MPVFREGAKALGSERSMKVMNRLLVNSSREKGSL